MVFSSNKSLIKNKAFTLIELLVVISIIGVLAALTAGAVFKYAAWQRDPTNPNSSVSITINTIKQALTRITQDIQQKSKQDYQALSPADKGYYQNLGNYLYSRNVTPAAIVLAEPEPNARAIQVYTNTQIIKNFPTLVSSISSAIPVYDGIDFNPSSPIQSIVLNTGSNPNYINFYPTPLANYPSLKQQLLTANTIIKNKPAAGSTPNRDSSACLLVALESHPKGLKVEDLGSGSILTDTTNARIIKPGGVVIYHKIHYVDAVDYAADKSLKVGSLRVDIAYDTE